MNGILLVDKPPAMTSFDVVKAVRRLTHEKKIGHTGTLDPMATGVLPLLLGKATKAHDLLPCHDKAYIAKMQLGITTDTLDTTGNVLSTQKVEVSAKLIEQLLPKYTGSIKQVPPMYSAIKVKGVRLYTLARQGREVERAARGVEIYELLLLDYNQDKAEATIYVHCSKGTYIRSLVSDMGRDLGCGAAMSGLNRVMSAGFKIEQCVSLDKLETKDKQDIEQLVLPIDSVFYVYGAVKVTKRQGTRFKNGGALDLQRLELDEKQDIFRVYTPENEFLGLGKVDRNRQQLKVLKLF